MRTKDSQILMEAVGFAARFGFLTKAIFFEFLCPRGGTQRYAYWQELVKRGYFVCSKRDPDVLYLSQRRIPEGMKAVPARYFYHLTHDALVAKVLLELQRTGLVEEARTEAQMKMDHWHTTANLGVGDLEKIPDLVMDLVTDHAMLRLAVEIEATRKSRARYDVISLSYLKMRNVDAVLFVCEDQALERQVEEAFKGRAFAGSCALMTTTIREFEETRLRASIRSNGRHMTLADFLIRALKVQREAFAKARLFPKTVSEIKPQTESEEV